MQTANRKDRVHFGLSISPYVHCFLTCQSAEAGSALAISRLRSGEKANSEKYLLQIQKIFLHLLCDNGSRKERCTDVAGVDKSEAVFCTFLISSSSIQMFLHKNSLVRVGMISLRNGMSIKGSAFFSILSQVSRRNKKRFIFGY